MIVADTNVLAYLLLPSSHTEMAERLLRTDPDWIAPVLWRSEMRNVLALYLRRSLISFEDAVRVQSEAEDLLRDREYDLNSHDVLSLVRESDCSAYDCEFVALAQGAGVRLVTADRRLVERFPDTAVLLEDAIAGA